MSTKLQQAYNEEIDNRSEPPLLGTTGTPITVYVAVSSNPGDDQCIECQSTPPFSPCANSLFQPDDYNGWSGMSNGDWIFAKIGDEYVGQIQGDGGASNISNRGVSLLNIQNYNDCSTANCTISWEYFIPQENLPAGAEESVCQNLGGEYQDNFETNLTGNPLLDQPSCWIENIHQDTQWLNPGTDGATTTSWCEPLLATFFFDTREIVEPRIVLNEMWGLSGNTNQKGWLEFFNPTPNDIYFDNNQARQEFRQCLFPGDCCEGFGYDWENEQARPDGDPTDYCSYPSGTGIYGILGDTDPIPCNFKINGDTECIEQLGENSICVKSCSCEDIDGYPTQCPVKNYEIGIKESSSSVSGDPSNYVDFIDMFMNINPYDGEEYNENYLNQYSYQSIYIPGTYNRFRYNPYLLMLTRGDDSSPKDGFYEDTNGRELLKEDFIYHGYCGEDRLCNTITNLESCLGENGQITTQCIFEPVDDAFCNNSADCEENQICGVPCNIEGGDTYPDACEDYTGNQFDEDTICHAHDVSSIFVMDGFDTDLNSSSSEIRINSAIKIRIRSSDVDYYQIYFTDNWAENGYSLEYTKGDHPNSGTGIDDPISNFSENWLALDYYGSNHFCESDGSSCAGPADSGCSGQYYCYFDPTVSCTPDANKKDANNCGHIGMLYGITNAEATNQNWTWCTNCLAQNTLNISPQMLKFVDNHDIRLSDGTNARYPNFTDSTNLNGSTSDSMFQWYATFGKTNKSFNSTPIYGCTNPLNPNYCGNGQCNTSCNEPEDGSDEWDEFYDSLDPFLQDQCDAWGDLYADGCCCDLSHLIGDTACTEGPAKNHWCVENGYNTVYDDEISEDCEEMMELRDLVHTPSLCNFPFHVYLDSEVYESDAAVTGKYFDLKIRTSYKILEPINVIFSGITITGADAVAVNDNGSNVGLTIDGNQLQITPTDGYPNTFNHHIGDDNEGDPGTDFTVARIYYSNASGGYVGGFDYGYSDATRDTWINGLDNSKVPYAPFFCNESDPINGGGMKIVEVNFNGALTPYGIGIGVDNFQVILGEEDIEENGIFGMYVHDTDYDSIETVIGDMCYEVNCIGELTDYDTTEWDFNCPGTCLQSGDTPCVQDCAGIWGGDSEIDGTCIGACIVPAGGCCERCTQDDVDNGVEGCNFWSDCKIETTAGNCCPGHDNDVCSEYPSGYNESMGIITQEAFNRDLLNPTHAMVCSPNSPNPGQPCENYDPREYAMDDEGNDLYNVCGTNCGVTTCTASKECIPAGNPEIVDCFGCCIYEDGTDCSPIDFNADYDNCGRCTGGTTGLTACGESCYVDENGEREYCIDSDELHCASDDNCGNCVLNRLEVEGEFIDYGCRGTAPTSVSSVWSVTGSPNGVNQESSIDNGGEITIDDNTVSYPNLCYEWNEYTAYGTNGLEITVNGCYDCSGTINGSSEFDDCGQCGELNADEDCGGKCYGGATVDNCNQCVCGSTQWADSTCWMPINSSGNPAAGSKIQDGGSVGWRADHDGGILDYPTTDNYYSLPCVADCTGETPPSAGQGDNFTDDCGVCYDPDDDIPNIIKSTNVDGAYYQAPNGNWCNYGEAPNLGCDCKCYGNGTTSNLGPSNGLETNKPSFDENCLPTYQDSGGNDGGNFCEEGQNPETNTCCDNNPSSPTFGVNCACTHPSNTQNGVINPCERDCAGYYCDTSAPWNYINCAEKDNCGDCHEKIGRGCVSGYPTGTSVGGNVVARCVDSFDEYLLCSTISSHPTAVDNWTIELDGVALDASLYSNNCEVDTGKCLCYQGNSVDWSNGSVFTNWDGKDSCNYCSSYQGICTGCQSPHEANILSDCQNGTYVYLEDGNYDFGGPDFDCSCVCNGEKYINECQVCQTEGNHGTCVECCEGDCTDGPEHEGYSTDGNDLAEFDDCDVCYSTNGGNNNHVADSDKDCAGSCFNEGGASIDKCNVCICGTIANGGTDSYTNTLICDDSDANHDMDCSGYCNGSSYEDFCDVCICVDIENGDLDAYDNVASCTTETPNTSCCSYGGTADVDKVCTCYTDGGTYGNGYCPTGQVNGCYNEISNCGVCDGGNQQLSYWEDCDDDGLGSGTSGLYCPAGTTYGDDANDSLHIPDNYVLVSAGTDSYPWCTQNSYNVCNVCNGSNTISDLTCSGCNTAGAINNGIRSYCLGSSQDNGSPGGNTGDFGTCVEVGGSCSGFTDVHTTGNTCSEGGAQTATSTCKQYSETNGYGFCRFNQYCNDSSALMGAGIPTPYNSVCAGNNGNNTCTGDCYYTPTAYIHGYQILDGSQTTNYNDIVESLSNTFNEGTIIRIHYYVTDKTLNYGPTSHEITVSNLSDNSLTNSNNTATAYTALTGYSNVPTTINGVQVRHFYRDVTPVDVELTGTYTHKLSVNNGYDTNISSDTADYNWQLVEDNTIMGIITSINTTTSGTAVTKTFQIQDNDNVGNVFNFTNTIPNTNDYTIVGPTYVSDTGNTTNFSFTVLENPVGQPRSGTIRITIDNCDDDGSGQAVCFREFNANFVDNAGSLSISVPSTGTANDTGVSFTSTASTNDSNQAETYAWSWDYDGSTSTSADWTGVTLPAVTTDTDIVVTCVYTIKDSEGSTLETLTQTGTISVSPKYGCTDSDGSSAHSDSENSGAACNYDPDATVDDNSCTYTACNDTCYTNLQYTAGLAHSNDQCGTCHQKTGNTSYVHTLWTCDTIIGSGTSHFQYGTNGTSAECGSYTNQCGDTIGPCSPGCSSTGLPSEPDCNTTTGQCECSSGTYDCENHCDTAGDYFGTATRTGPGKNESVPTGQSMSNSLKLCIAGGSYDGKYGCDDCGVCNPPNGYAAWQGGKRSYVCLDCNGNVDLDGSLLQFDYCGICDGNNDRSACNDYLALVTGNDDNTVVNDNAGYIDIFTNLNCNCDCFNTDNDTTGKHQDCIDANNYCNHANYTSDTDYSWNSCKDCTQGTESSGYPMCYSEDGTDCPPNTNLGSGNNTYAYNDCDNGYDDGNNNCTQNGANGANCVQSCDTDDNGNYIFGDPEYIAFIDDCGICSGGIGDFDTGIIPNCMIGTSNAGCANYIIQTNYTIADYGFGNDLGVDITCSQNSCSDGYLINNCGVCTSGGAITPVKCNGNCPTSTPEGQDENSDLYANGVNATLSNCGWCSHDSDGVAIDSGTCTNNLCTSGLVGKFCESDTDCAWYDEDEQCNGECGPNDLFNSNLINYYTSNCGDCVCGIQSTDCTDPNYINDTGFANECIENDCMDSGWCKPQDGSGEYWCSYRDGCNVCSGANSGHEYNSDKDCRCEFVNPTNGEFVSDYDQQYNGSWQNRCDDNSSSVGCDVDGTETYFDIGDRDCGVCKNTICPDRTTDDDVTTCGTTCRNDDIGTYPGQCGISYMDPQCDNHPDCGDDCFASCCNCINPDDLTNDIGTNECLASCDAYNEFYDSNCTLDMQSNDDYGPNSQSHLNNGNIFCSNNAEKADPETWHCCNNDSSHENYGVNCRCVNNIDVMSCGTDCRINPLDDSSNMYCIEGNGVEPCHHTDHCGECGNWVQDLFPAATGYDCRGNGSTDNCIYHSGEDLYYHEYYLDDCNYCNPVRTAGNTISVDSSFNCLGNSDYTSSTSTNPYCDGTWASHSGNQNMDCHETCYPAGTGQVGPVDSIFDTLTIFDNYASPDTCNICAGGSTGTAVNANLNSCGICFATGTLNNCNECITNATECTVDGGHSDNFDNTTIDYMCVVDNTCTQGCSGSYYSLYDENFDASPDSDYPSDQYADACGQCGGDAIGYCTNASGETDTTPQQCYQVAKTVGDLQLGVQTSSCNPSFPLCIVSSASNVDYVLCDGYCSTSVGGISNAFLDTCGVCSAGQSGHTANTDVDCNGDCLQTTPNGPDNCDIPEGEAGCAFIDGCDNCVSGNTNNTNGCLDPDTHEPEDGVCVENWALGCDSSYSGDYDTDPNQVCYAVGTTPLDYDDCNVCGGDNSIKDCSGRCPDDATGYYGACGQDHTIVQNSVCGYDECGNCGGDAFYINCYGNDDCDDMDCAGVCGQTSVIDDCGVCGGNSWLDGDHDVSYTTQSHIVNQATCNYDVNNWNGNIWNGNGNNSYMDCECTCKDDSTPAFNAYIDDCDYCVGGINNAPVTQTDCRGAAGGGCCQQVGETTPSLSNSTYCNYNNDGCECNSPDKQLSDHRCDGVCAADAAVDDAHIDNCGHCVSTYLNNSDCTADCAGDWIICDYATECVRLPHIGIDYSYGLDYPNAASIAPCANGTGTANVHETCTNVNSGLSYYSDRCGINELGDACVEGLSGKSECTYDCTGNYCMDLNQPVGNPWESNYPYTNCAVINTCNSITQCVSEYLGTTVGDYFVDCLTTYPNGDDNPYDPGFCDTAVCEIDCAGNETRVGDVDHSTTDMCGNCVLGTGAGCNIEEGGDGVGYYCVDTPCNQQCNGEWCEPDIEGDMLTDGFGCAVNFTEGDCNVCISSNTVDCNVFQQSNDCTDITGTADLGGNYYVSPCLIQCVDSLPNTDCAGTYCGPKILESEYGAGDCGYCGVADEQFFYTAGVNTVDNPKCNGTTCIYTFGDGPDCNTTCPDDEESAGFSYYDFDQDGNQCLCIEGTTGNSAGDGQSTWCSDQDGDGYGCADEPSFQLCVEPYQTKDGYVNNCDESGLYCGCPSDNFDSCNSCQPVSDTEYETADCHGNCPDCDPCTGGNYLGACNNHSSETKTPGVCGYDDRGLCGGPNTDCSNGYNATTCPDMDCSGKFPPTGSPICTDDLFGNDKDESLCENYIGDNGNNGVDSCGNCGGYKGYDINGNIVNNDVQTQVTDCNWLNTNVGITCGYPHNNCGTQLDCTALNTNCTTNTTTYAGAGGDLPYLNASFDNYTCIDYICTCQTDIPECPDVDYQCGFVSYDEILGCGTSGTVDCELANCDDIDLDIDNLDLYTCVGNQCTCEYECCDNQVCRDLDIYCGNGSPNSGGTVDTCDAICNSGTCECTPKDMDWYINQGTYSNATEICVYFTDDNNLACGNSIEISDRCGSTFVVPCGEVDFGTDNDCPPNFLCGSDS